MSALALGHRRSTQVSGMTVPAWVWLGLIPALMMRFVGAWLPLDVSFSLSVPDDAYYYFTIARNIASGNGVTFDLLEPTNGFHPLWMALITPFWWLADRSDTFAVHEALSLGALFDIVTITGIWSLSHILLQRQWISGITVLAYAWNPYTLATSVNGLETSLGIMLFVWSLEFYWIVRRNDHPNWRHWLGLGVLWSLLTLARTDYLLILAPCIADLAWRQGRKLMTMWPAVLGGVLWIPWLAWNWQTFGTFSQVSGKAYPYYLHTIWWHSERSLQDYVWQEGRMAYGIFANLARFSGFSKGIVLLFLVVLGLVIYAWSRRNLHDLPQTEIAWDTLSGLLWPTIGATSLLLIHGLARWMYVPWYFSPMSLLLVFWFAADLNWLVNKSFFVAVLIAGAFIGYQLISGINLWQVGGMYPAQAQDVKAQLPVLLDQCKEVDIIGISDSGYFGYSLPCQIVNLDGVVNNQAFRAIQQGNFREYLDSIGIQRVHINPIIRDVVAINEGDIPENPPFSAAP